MAWHAMLFALHAVLFLRLTAPGALPHDAPAAARQLRVAP
jgi:hypothetical protein